MPPLPGGADGSLLGSALSMAAALCLILGLLFLGFYLLRRFGPMALARVKGGPAPTLAGRLFLGNRQSVAVVRVQGRTLVLGVTEHQVNLLTEITDADGRAKGEGFANVLEGQDAQGPAGDSR